MRLLFQLSAPLLFAISLAAVSADECPPADCGFVHNISFPFWIEGIHHPSCGMPDTKLICKDQSPQIVISNMNYAVKSMDSSDSSKKYLIVSPADSELFACLFLRSEFSFNSTYIVLNEDRREEKLYFFFNCSETLVPEPYMSVNCGQRNNSFVSWRGENTDVGVCERFSSLYSAADMSVKKNNLTGILEAGFFMRVTEENCGGCQWSGGKCRYNVQEKRFGCLCGDKLRLDLCLPEGEMTVPEKRSDPTLGLTLAGVFVFLFFILFGYIVWKKRTNRDAVGMDGDGLALLKNINALIHKNGELTHFDIVTIELATDNFSPENKIGAGGFGEVYKGTLQNGQIIAVKRISFESQERINEFMMEVKVIAKLRHRNLVKLIGCCIEGCERLLVYEFVPNKSLDFFIFGNEEKRMLLSWETRLAIILGIARGLLYLHQDSRLRVIHRDLKAANILLEENMNPKISDFGTARIFERQQIDDNTIKIVGTIGYMSPEYIMSGIFSEKSDIFSFGVLVIEIISGRRNKWVSHKGHCMELLSNAWTLFMENQSHRLLDSTLNHPTQVDHIIKYIRVGLLCVQEAPEDRPTMQEVVLMLDKENPCFRQPKTPGFFKPIMFPLDNDSMSQHELTITNLEGR